MEEEAQQGRRHGAAVMRAEGNHGGAPVLCGRN
jgi:hypothetical protein